MLLLRLLVLFMVTALGAQEAVTINADEALDRLMEGNKRFMEAMAIHPNQTMERREKVANKHTPFAVVVCCSDSRVPPEIVFDQGIGDIFVVRVAGNVVGAIELDSVEYATAILGANLVIVMGHEGCGAMQAIAQGRGVAIDIENIVPFVQPLFEQAKAMPGDLTVNLTKLNVTNVVAYLKTTAILSSLLKKNNLKITGGYYHMRTGEVELLP